MLESGPAPQKASDLPAIFNLAIAVLGPGILSMSFVLREAGLVLGSVMLLLAALACDYTTARLCDCAWKSRDSHQDLIADALERSEDRSLDAIMDRAFGSLGRVASVCVVSLYLFGCICGNLVAVVPLLQRVLREAFGLQATRASVVACISLLELPLCLVKDLGVLGRGSSALGLLATLVLPLLLAVRVASTGPASESVPSFEATSLSAAFPIALYAFTAQPYCLPVFFDEVAASARGACSTSIAKRQRQVGAWAMILAFALQYSVGLLGAILFGATVESNLLLSFADGDVLASWLSGTTALSVCLCLPMNYFPLGQILDKRQWRRVPKPHAGQLAHSLHAILVLGAAGFIAATVNDIFVVFDVTGSSASALLVFAFPCMAWLRLFEDNPWRRRCIIVTLALGGACSLASFLLTLQTDFGGS
eukprot:TRINITY_DN32808_c0_g1_i1.p1 TRINITY_DN32808_c0_g1~~TRINITY_DN32808_c0_g1_i1.p1  ORF type:complete len:422 (+),score=59.98 TRINITY_DN32808_c0_g1_i1:39-1304(+)